MGSRRGRIQSERRFAKASRRIPITIGTIAIIVLVVVAIGLSRTCG